LGGRQALATGEFCELLIFLCFSQMFDCRMKSELPWKKAGWLFLLVQEFLCHRHPACHRLTVWLLKSVGFLLKKERKTEHLEKQREMAR